MAPLGVPVFPVNLGTLGFIAAIHPEEWLEVFENWMERKARLSRRLMLDTVVKRGEKEVLRGSCLNDVVISASGIAKIIRLRVSSGDMPLGEYRSDGLIVATPTGSTAYSVAAGGPILDPELEALIINPICPFTLSHRPMVLPAGETVVVEVEAEQRSGVLLTVDGQVTEPLEPGDKIYIAKAPLPALLVASGRDSFYQALRTKLSWMGVPGSGETRIPGFGGRDD
jgi:NAD+ kinase